MSFESYTKWWIVSKKHLEDLNARDELFRKKAKPITKRKLANMLIGDLFSRYSMLVQELDTCLDQMAQPQKRMTVKKIVDSAAIRLLELNEEMKNIDFSEYHYIDGSLIELKLIPYDVEILHPTLFCIRPVNIEDMWKKLKLGERIFTVPKVSDQLSQDKISEKPEQQPEPEADSAEVKKKTRKERRSIGPIHIEEKTLTLDEQEQLNLKETVTECVKIIQTAERARQERIYFDIKFSMLQQRKLEKLKATTSSKAPASIEIDLDTPCTKIQSFWRGHRAREAFKIKEKTRRLLIGMYEPESRSTKEFDIMEQNMEKRREYRDQRIREYIQAIDQEKARILRVVAPGLMEDIGDEIREWFRVWYYSIRMFDKYPSVEKGGTILVVRGETMTPKEYLDEYERKRREKVKNKGVDKKAEKEKQEKLKKEAEKKKKEAEAKKKEAEAKKKKKKKGKKGEYEFEYKDPKGKPLYDDGMKEYHKMWDERNDFDNPLEKPYIDIISEQEYYENQLEVRKKIDEMMRIELDLLNEALEEDRIRMKGKKGRKKKKKKGKKGKGKRKRGKRGKKDPTGNRTIEDLFQELFDNGIIRTYPKASLSDYFGDFSYKNWELRNLDFDPPATLLDVRQAISMNCIIPMGVENMKRPKSVLIAGPSQSGKHLLANAIFNETRCVLFDLSPERTANKYPGAKGMKMFIHLVNKMSRILAPSIIYFDAAEKIFYKKVPPSEKELEPKRIGKKLLKGIIKPITPADRVLILGVTNKPWAAQAAKLKKAFERNLLIPRTDYNSLYLYWRELLMPYHGIDRNFNVTALAKVTVNYPLPVIKNVIEQIMTPRRIIQLSYKPLGPQEIYEFFLAKGLEPVPDKEYKKFLKWYNKTPLGKERSAFNKWADFKREQEARANEKKKK